MEKNKDKKLLDKVEKLCQKLETEENALKRAIYSAKLNFLMARIQKELDIIEIKEKYNEEIENIEQFANIRAKEITRTKMKAIQEKKKYSSRLSGIAEFDPTSSDFAFQEELDSVGGDVNKLIEMLKEDGEDVIAESIERACELGKKYDEYDTMLEESKSKRKEIEKEMKTRKKEKERENKALVSKRKENIFKRIFNAIKNGIAEYKNKKIAKKAYENDISNFENLENQNEEEELEIVNKEYQKKLQEIEADYQKRLENLNEKYEKLKNEVQEPHAKNKEEFRKNKTSEYRASMVNDEAIKKTRELAKKWQETKEVKEDIEETVEQDGEEQDL